MTLPELYWSYTVVLIAVKSTVEEIEEEEE